MAEIGLLVTDLDRTLLRTDKTISAYTAQVLRRCQACGIKVVFATARPLRTVRQFLGDICADAVILHNGAVVIAKDELLFHYGIAPETTGKILHAIALDNPQATLSVEIDDVLYANFDTTSLWSYTQATRSDFTDLPDKPADKVIVGVSSMQDIQRLARVLPEELYMEMSDGKLGLIMHRSATKQSAVKGVARYYGCCLEKAVAFGDDYNDLQMLRECGVGVAVANALDEVKAAANAICGPNDSDGVAKWIEVHVLGEGKEQSTYNCQA